MTTAGPPSRAHRRRPCQAGAVPRTPAPGPHPDARLHRQNGDGWVACACGDQHWGLNGAAGLLLWREGRDGGVELVLQHRALWSHHGGTWGVPGGALADGEGPLDGAVREATEEAGVPADGLRVRASRVLAHPDWSYTTVLAEATTDVEPRVADPESLEVAWVRLEDLAGLPLLPAFERSLPELRAMLLRVVLVVDAANVVGSVPDGWWKDRYGATSRLRDHLTGLGRDGLAADVLGLPGARWYPDVLLVTEGQARGVEAVDGVAVVAAPGSGDEEIVAQVARLVRGPGPGETAASRTRVVVATADRGLAARVESLGATTVGPRAVRG